MAVTMSKHSKIRCNVPFTVRFYLRNIHVIFFLYLIIITADLDINELGCKETSAISKDITDS